MVRHRILAISLPEITDPLLLKASSVMARLQRISKRISGEGQLSKLISALEGKLNVKNIDK